MVCEQEHELGGVQVHLLDGVCTPHVGARLGPCLCCSSCLFWCQRLHELSSGQEPRAVLLDGRHPRPCRLVDGQKRPAGVVFALKGYTQVFFQRLQLPLPLQNQHMPVFLAHAILLYLLYDCLQGQLLQDPRQLTAVWLGLQSALKYCTGAVHLGASDVFI